VNGVVDGEMRMRLEDIEQQVKDTKLGSVLRWDNPLNLFSILFALA